MFSNFFVALIDLIFAQEIIFSSEKRGVFSTNLYTEELFPSRKPQSTLFTKRSRLIYKKNN